MFDTMRCKHDVPYTIVCPQCVLLAMERIERDRDLLADDLPQPELPTVPWGFDIHD